MFLCDLSSFSAQSCMFHHDKLNLTVSMAVASTPRVCSHEVVVILHIYVKSVHTRRVSSAEYSLVPATDNIFPSFDDETFDRRCQIYV